VIKRERNIHWKKTLLPPGKVIGQKLLCTPHIIASRSDFR
jgi:hypothetical protein